MQHSTPHIAFSDDLRWIGLAGIKLENTPETITVDHHILRRKSEFHITLMASKFLAPMLKEQSEDHARQLLKDDFLGFTKNHDLAQFTLSDEYYSVKREERESVVIMVNMPEIEPLFAYLRTKYDVAFPTQPAHITLYTKQPEKGIWLSSNDEIQRDGTRIQTSDLATLRVL